MTFQVSATLSLMSITMRIDLRQRLGDWRPIWRYFGYDEPNYTYMKDGQKLLSQLAALSPETVYIRAHNLLTSGDGTPALKWGSTNAYTEAPDGSPQYDWRIVDRIFDTYLERGLKPYVQMGFMPEALSSNPQPYQHSWYPGGQNPISTGWAYPPTDFKKWGALTHAWAQHSAERYGLAEASRWVWEVWNEPNIFYWRGTPEEYQTLYDFAVDGVKRALPNAAVGGPHIAGTNTPEAQQFMREFLTHCISGRNAATGGAGAPLDVVAFHAKGAPRLVNGHVQMGCAEQLQNIDRGFALTASFPEHRHKPIVIGESDPDGCAACTAQVYPQNAYRNGALFASYTAATFARKIELADRHGVNFEGALTWAFEFEEQPYFAGFRVLSSNGIALPVLNVFRMFGQMRGERLAVENSADLGLDAILNNGVRERPDVHAQACVADGLLSVMLWHYHDDDLPAAPERVTLTVDGLPAGDKPVLLRHFRIDETHSNTHTAWLQMGSPQTPTPEQYATLERASELTLLESPRWLRSANGLTTVEVVLPRQSVSLLQFEAVRG